MRCCVTYSPGAPLPTSRQQQRLLCCAGSVHPATLNGSANRSPTAWAGRSARGTPYSANAKQITELLAASGSTLTSTVGIGAITAGRLIGRTGRAARFPTAAAFANYAGAAPAEVASADKARHRLSRSGDRQLNAALHTVAITQIRTPGSRGHTYYNAKLAEGKTPPEARRCLKRRLANHIWRTMITDEQRQAASPGGHLGATLTSSAAGSTPTTSSSDKSLPGLTNHDSTTTRPAA